MFTIGNAFIARKLWLHNAGAGLTTASLVLRSRPTELIGAIAGEVAITASSRELTGYGGGLRYVRHEVDGDSDGMRRLRVTLEDADVNADARKNVRQPLDAPARLPAARLRVDVVYEVYPDVPLIRKWIEIENVGPVPILIERVDTERLRLRSIDAAVRHLRAGPLVAPITASMTADGGLVGVSIPSTDSGHVEMVFVNAAPGPLKRILLAANGAVEIGISSDAGGLWLQPEESARMPDVWTGLSSNGASSALTAMRTALAPDGSSPQQIYVLDAANAQLHLDQIPEPSLVCAPYAWQEEWDGDTGHSRQLHKLAQTVRAAGHAFGLWVPIAWMPANGELAKNRAWTALDANGATASASWQGHTGVQVSLTSAYADLAVQSLVAIVDGLELDALLIDGPVAEGGGSRSDRLRGEWEQITAFIRILKRLKSVRPGILLGSLGRTYGMSDGFDLTMHRLGFLWRFAHPAATLHTDPMGLWREAILLTDGGTR